MMHCWQRKVHISAGFSGLVRNILFTHKVIILTFFSSHTFFCYQYSVQIAWEFSKSSAAFE